MGKRRRERRRLDPEIQARAEEHRRQQEEAQRIERETKLAAVRAMHIPRTQRGKRRRR